MAVEPLQVALAGAVGAEPAGPVEPVEPGVQVALAVAVGAAGVQVALAVAGVLAVAAGAVEARA